MRRGLWCWRRLEIAPVAGIDLVKGVTGVRIVRSMSDLVCMADRQVLKNAHLIPDVVRALSPRKGSVHKI